VDLAVGDLCISFIKSLFSLGSEHICCINVLEQEKKALNKEIASFKAERAAEGEMTVVDAEMSSLPFDEQQSQIIEISTPPATPQTKKRGRSVMTKASTLDRANALLDAEQLRKSKDEADTRRLKKRATESSASYQDEDAIKHLDEKDFQVMHQYMEFATKRLSKEDQERKSKGEKKKQSGKRKVTTEEANANSKKPKSKSAVEKKNEEKNKTADSSSSATAEKKKGKGRRCEHRHGSNTTVQLVFYCENGV